MPLPLPEYSYVAYALAVSVYLSIGAFHWTLGRRSVALYYVETAAWVLLYILLVLFIEEVAARTAAMLGVNVPPASGAAALENAAKVFEAARQYSISWILDIASLRAALSLTPITSPLSYVLGSATGWSMTVFELCAINFLFYRAASLVLSEIHPYLISLGATLMPIPRLRSIGSALLSAAITYTTAFLLYSNIVGSALASLPAPPTINPLDWVRIASLASDAAIPLTKILVEGFVIMSLAAIVAAGLSQTLAGSRLLLKLGV